MERHVVRLNEQCLCRWDEPATGEGILQPPAWRVPYPFFISTRQDSQILAFIDVYDRLTRRSEFIARVVPERPSVIRHVPAAQGVFDGYDFHLTAEGPRLIEVNTNAGGSYLSAGELSHPRGCVQGESLPVLNHYESSVLAMFRNEMAAQFPGEPLKTVVILDETPTQQFLYPEMLKFVALFQRAGIQAWITSPEALTYREGALWYQGHQVDLIYNRHVDFYLSGEAMRVVREAYLASAVVLTPNPRAYGLRADKRLLSLMSDPEFLEEMRLTGAERALIEAVVPETKRVSAANAESLWRDRKHWFFKPAAGYGSKAAYRGAKLTRSTWESILASDYVAQRFVEPSRRVVQVEGETRLLKADLRYYTYGAQVLHRVSRLYEGQTTNMRTPGGGFSPVVVLGAAENGESALRCLS